MTDTLWERVRTRLMDLALVSGVLFGSYLALTPLLGDLTPFDGLEWTAIGVVWIAFELWRYSRVT